MEAKPIALVSAKAQDRSYRLGVTTASDWQKTKVTMVDGGKRLTAADYALDHYEATETDPSTGETRTTTYKPGEKTAVPIGSAIKAVIY